MKSKIFYRVSLVKYIVQGHSVYSVLINELQEFLEQNDVNALVMKCTDDVSIEIKVDENKRNDILSLLHGYIYR